MSISENFSQRIEELEDWHAAALTWYHERAGTLSGWPSPFSFRSTEVLLASKPKGIYKPSGLKYALSVRQGLQSSYDNIEPVYREDGTWSYLYYQEDADPLRRDKHYTNLGLLECLKDRVPVGVLRQTAKSPTVVYQIFGVANVVEWKDGYFLLEGYSKSGSFHGWTPENEFHILESLHKARAQTDEFEVSTELDARERVVASIVRRRGQPEFRKLLIRVYGERCCISGWGALPALEAAHIAPYRGPYTNTAPNGLLLRADIHTLFDLGLIGVDPVSMKVAVSRKIKDSEYRNLEGVPLRLPVARADWPDAEALRVHLSWSRILG